MDALVKLQVRSRRPTPQAAPAAAVVGLVAGVQRPAGKTAGPLSHTIFKEAHVLYASQSSLQLGYMAFSERAELSGHTSRVGPTCTGEKHGL